MTEFFNLHDTILNVYKPGRRDTIHNIPMLLLSEDTNYEPVDILFQPIRQYLKEIDSWIAGESNLSWCYMNYSYTDIQDPDPSDTDFEFLIRQMMQLMNITWGSGDGKGLVVRDILPDKRKRRLITKKKKS
jgi:hypothetical protein